MSWVDPMQWPRKSETAHISGKMITQYPHYLYTDQIPAASEQDANGNWNFQTPAAVLLSRCREETEPRAREIQASDGKFYTYSSVVQLPKGTAPVAEGTEIYVKDFPDSTRKRICGKVLKFDSSQLHCRIWV